MLVDLRRRCQCHLVKPIARDGQHTRAACRAALLRHVLLIGCRADTLVDLTRLKLLQLLLGLLQLA